MLNNPVSISNFGVTELEICDHSLIYVVKKLVPLKEQRKCIEIRNFKNFNERLFLADLSTIPWECILNNSIIRVIVGRLAEKEIFRQHTRTGLEILGGRTRICPTRAEGARISRGVRGHDPQESFEK